MKESRSKFLQGMENLKKNIETNFQQDLWQWNGTVEKKLNFKKGTENVQMLLLRYLHDNSHCHVILTVADETKEFHSRCMMIIMLVKQWNYGSYMLKNYKF